MAQRSGNIRTQKGLELEKKHQATYEKWWLGKRIETNHYKDYPKSKELISGVVKRVEYIGNSMCGVVKLHLDNGYEWLISQGISSYRPCKEDVKILSRVGKK